MGHRDTYTLLRQESNIKVIVLAPPPVPKTLQHYLLLADSNILHNNMKILSSVNSELIN